MQTNTYTLHSQLLAQSRVCKQSIIRFTILHHAALITGRICPKGSSAGIAFTHGPTRCTDYGLLLPTKFDLDWFRGGGLRPQN